jgi:hypothetical protein
VVDVLVATDDAGMAASERDLDGEEPRQHGAYGKKAVNSTNWYN